MGQKLPLKQKKAEILGIKVDMVSLKKAVSLVEKWVKCSKQYQIVTPNPEQIVLAQENLEFRRVLNKADLAIPDGVGLVWATRRKLKVKSPKLKVHRVSGVDLMMELCKLAAKKKWRVFLLGGKEGVAESAAKILNTKYKILNTDYYSGSFDIENENQRERQEVIKKINKFRPHLLFVAYGAPEQELWVAKNLPKLKVKVAMGVGGAFDYVSGRVARAPGWMRKTGFEWLYRLLREPWRIKRQLALVKFVWLAIFSKAAPLERRE